jgi:hypothetical protein
MMEVIPHLDRQAEDQERKGYHMRVDLEFILARNPHLSRDEVVRRAALTPEMLARIADYRAGFEPLFIGPESQTDEQIALGFVAADAARERDALATAAEGEGR